MKCGFFSGHGASFKRFHNPNGLGATCSITAPDWSPHDPCWRFFGLAEVHASKPPARSHVQQRSSSASPASPLPGEPGIPLAFGIGERRT
jgi:hypothetical protein